MFLSDFKPALLSLDLFIEFSLETFILGASLPLQKTNQNNS